VHTRVVLNAPVHFHYNPYIISKSNILDRRRRVNYKFLRWNSRIIALTYDSRHNVMAQSTLIHQYASTEDEV